VTKEYSSDELSAWRRNCAHSSGLVEGYCNECQRQVAARIPPVLQMQSQQNAYPPDGVARPAHTGTGVATGGLPLAGDANPKTLTGALKVPVFTVVPPASIIGEAEAMRYGAFEAPRVDGSKGYGPFNWRDQKIEAMTYIDANQRHIMAWVDGEELAPDSLVHHLKHAKASLGILIDAIEHSMWIDNRPKVRQQVASTMLERGKRK
jgi:Domain of unknown function (DUF5664)